VYFSTKYTYDYVTRNGMKGKCKLRGKKNLYTTSFEYLEGNRPFRKKQDVTCEDIIKMDLK
jgi:hypothetical protein